MLRKGLHGTNNSDDPGGYLDDNRRRCATPFTSTGSTLATLARNSITASFAGDSRKATLLAEVATASAST